MSSETLSRIHWVRPELVAEVKYLTWTTDNLLRQVVYEGLREDKPATDGTSGDPKRLARGDRRWQSGVPYRVVRQKDALRMEDADQLKGFIA
jgi:hypothetical protein